MRIPELLRAGWSLCFLASSLLIANVAAAQETSPQELPSVETVLERHLDAIGGAEALAAVSSLHKQGLYIYNGLEHPLSEWRVRPGRSRVEVDGLQMAGTSLKPGQTLVSASDGEAAWTLFEALSPEPKKLEGKEAASALEQGDFDGPLVDTAKKGHKARLVGRESRDGQDVWHLEVTLASGGVEQWFLDASSYLPVAKSVEVEDPRAFFNPRSWFYDDYRAVAGVQLPFYVFVEEKVFSREQIYSKIEANVEVDPALFAMPKMTQAEATE